MLNNMDADDDDGHMEEEEEVVAASAAVAKRGPKRTAKGRPGDAAGGSGAKAARRSS